MSKGGERESVRGGVGWGLECEGGRGEEREVIGMEEKGRRMREWMIRKRKGVEGEGGLHHSLKRKN